MARSIFEIKMDVLGVLDDGPQKQYGIMRFTPVDYRAFNKIMPDLLTKGNVVKNEKTYTITEQGKTNLVKYRELRENV